MLRRLGIEPGEGQLFTWGVASLFLLGWADVSLKNVSETFFLKRVGVELLPLVFLANSVLLVATTYGVGLVAARRNRLRMISEGGEETDYTDLGSVRDEVALARRLCSQHDWPVIDVTRRSIEETAATIMNFFTQHVSVEV